MKSVLYRTKFNKGRMIDKAIQKYGPDCWIYRPLATATSREELNSLEIKFIEELDSRNRNIGYNMSKGGQSGLGWKKGRENPVHSFTDETLKKISQGVSKALKGVPKSEKHRQSMTISRTGCGNHFYGKKHSDEYVNKMKTISSNRHIEIIDGKRKWVRN